MVVYLLLLGFLIIIEIKSLGGKLVCQNILRLICGKR